MNKRRLTDLLDGGISEIGTFYLEVYHITKVKEFEFKDIGEVVHLIIQYTNNRRKFNAFINTDIIKYVKDKEGNILLQNY